METSVRAQELIHWLGQQMGIVDLSFDDDGLVVLDINDKQTLVLGFEAELGTIFMFSPIQGTDGKRSGGLLERLLAANFIWQETQGATLALDKETDHVVLQQRLTIAAFSNKDFESRLETFVNTVQSFSKIAIEAALAIVPTAPQTTTEMMPNVMRV